MIDRTEPPAIVNLKEYENGTVRANAGFSVASSSREKTIELAWFHYLAFCAPALDQRTAEIVAELRDYASRWRTDWSSGCSTAIANELDAQADAIERRYPQTGTRHE